LIRVGSPLRHLDGQCRLASSGATPRAMAAQTRQHTPPVPLSTSRWSVRCHQIYGTASSRRAGRTRRCRARLSQSTNSRRHGPGRCQFELTRAGALVRNRRSTRGSWAARSLRRRCRLRTTGESRTRSGSLAVLIARTTPSRAEAPTPVGPGETRKVLRGIAFRRMGRHAGVGTPC